MSNYEKIVVVTGSCSPVGQAVCRAFAAKGAAVAVCDRCADSAKKLAAELAAGGAEAEGFKVDFSAQAELSVAGDAIAARFGRIDVLINADNTELPDGQRKPLHEMDYAGMVKHIDAGIKGMFRFSKRCAQDMALHSSGAIVNITSVRGLVPVGGQTPVVAVAAAVIGMTKMWGVEMREKCIRANCIAAGITGSQLPFEEQPDIMRKKLSHLGIRRPASPEEIAAAAVFLASDEASYITGAVLPVDGGMSAGYVRAF